jgi:hypothetical protein
MFSYSHPAFVYAEIAYRHERAAKDWAARHDTDGNAVPARRSRRALAALAALRPTPRHHRHA